MDRFLFQKSILKVSVHFWKLRESGPAAWDAEWYLASPSVRGCTPGPQGVGVPQHWAWQLHNLNQREAFFFLQSTF